MKTKCASIKTWLDYGIEIPESATGEYATTCPECSQTRKKSKVKCFSINVEKEVGQCHHCGLKINLRKNTDSMIHTDESKKLTRPPQLDNVGKLPVKVLKWFEKRGISEKVLSRNKIGYGKVFMPQVNREVNAIQFQYLKDCKIANVKYRDGNKNFRQVQGAEKLFYKIDDIKDKPEIIVTEGEIDALSLEEAGFKNCISVPDGAPPPNSNKYDSKFDYLESAYNNFNDAGKVILATDNDAAGIRLAEELGRRIGKEKCWTVTYPTGCKDGNDVLIKYGKEALKKVIENAKPFPINGVYEINDLEEKIYSLYRDGYKKGLKTGWPKIDEYYTVRPGEMTILTGIPGHGKTEFLDNLMMNLVRLESYRFGIFSAENLPLECHFAKLAEKYAGLPFNNGPNKRMTEEDLDEIIQHLNQHVYFIMPNEDQSNLNNILNSAKALIFRKGINGIVLDPWNELVHHRDSSQTETEYISQALSKIRRFARVNDVHIWLVAHPTKLQKLANGKYPIPTPYDISGSAHWRNKADNCLCVYRDFQTDAVQLHIQKIRFKEVGKVGVVDLYYIQATGTYRTESPTCWSEISAR